MMILLQSLIFLLLFSHTASYTSQQQFLIAMCQAAAAVLPNAIAAIYDPANSCYAYMPSLPLVPATLSTSAGLCGLASTVALGFGSPGCMLPQLLDQATIANLTAQGVLTSSMSAWLNLQQTVTTIEPAGGWQWIELNGTKTTPSTPIPWAPGQPDNNGGVANQGVYNGASSGVADEKGSTFVPTGTLCQCYGPPITTTTSTTTTTTTTTKPTTTSTSTTTTTKPTTTSTTTTTTTKPTTTSTSTTTTTKPTTTSTTTTTTTKPTTTSTSTTTTTKPTTTSTTTTTTTKPTTTSTSTSTTTKPTTTSSTSTTSGSSAGTTSLPSTSTTTSSSAISSGTTLSMSSTSTDTTTITTGTSVTPSTSTSTTTVTAASSAATTTATPLSTTTTSTTTSTKKPTTSTSTTTTKKPTTSTTTTTTKPTTSTTTTTKKPTTSTTTTTKKPTTSTSTTTTKKPTTSTTTTTTKPTTSTTTSTKKPTTSTSTTTTKKSTTSTTTTTTKPTTSTTTSTKKPTTSTSTTTTKKSATSTSTTAAKKPTTSTSITTTTIPCSIMGVDPDVHLCSTPRNYKVYPKVADCAAQCAAETNFICKAFVWMGPNSGCVLHGKIDLPVILKDGSKWFLKDLDCATGNNNLTCDWPIKAQNIDPTTIAAPMKAVNVQNSNQCQALCLLRVLQPTCWAYALSTSSVFINGYNCFLFPQLTASQSSAAGSGIFTLYQNRCKM